MPSKIALKYLLLFLPLLCFMQIIIYNQMELKNIDLIMAKTGTLKSTYTAQHDLITQMKDRLLQLEEAIPVIINEVPASILIGFEDYEARIVTFYDYLQANAPKNIDAEFQIDDDVTFSQTISPIYEKNIDFIFRFNNLQEAKIFLNYTLKQVEMFPLKVRSLSIERNENEKTDGHLQATLVIPAPYSFKIAN